MQYTSAFVCALGAVSVKALAFTSLCVFVFLSDSKQNGDANVALSEEEICSLTQPLSPSERWSLRCTRGRDKTKMEATCFLLTPGDPNAHTGKLHTSTHLDIHIYCWYGCFFSALWFQCTSLRKFKCGYISVSEGVCVVPPLVLSGN